ncbi:MAG: glutamate formimidoyltransferase [Candidatus Riflebacteria bacterium HGW-Riflebacteria-1]|nr:MAG: glutamate formimidoyltransferase [Candidatus Riflebacteria bacterium HGW-Riflebacteria-1]
MKKIVECVPNFSEGRDQAIIDAISDAIRSVKGVTLLDVDPGKSTNRTVYTFVGDPEAIIEGALASARVARKLIDMTTQTGEHPRMGAMDVCPFVPVANVSMEECVEISKKFAERAAAELEVPFYLYEYSQDKDYRKKLPQIRKGEYEALPEKIVQPDWKPDYGPAKFVPSWGATVTGARFFLVAYNVNILGTSNQAHRIALDLREAGRSPSEPGRFKELKGLGWFVDEYNMAQCSFNLNNFNVTTPHEVYEAVKEEAAKIGVGVAGSELVGLIPLEAMLKAADYYIERENLFILDEDQKIKLVIDRLGLNSVAQFKPAERIIEYITREEPNEPLANMSTRKFIEAINARTSAPGGGSASAAIAAIGAGLGAMVAKLTYGVRKFEHLEGRLRKVIPVLHEAALGLVPMIDADTNAFNDYVEAMRLPQGSDEEKKHRVEQMELGLKKAIEVPLQTMRIGDKAWEGMLEAATIGNIASKSDVQVGARALETGIWGAYQNVMINVAGIKDSKFVSEKTGEAEKLKERAAKFCAEIQELIEKRKE